MDPEPEDEEEDDEWEYGPDAAGQSFEAERWVMRARARRVEEDGGFLHP